MIESMAFSNELCKKLNQDSHKRATIPESQRYNAHFDYYDLVRRLNKLKEEREQKNMSSPHRLEINLVAKKEQDQITSIRKKIKQKTLNPVNTERAHRQESQKLLPVIKSPRKTNAKGITLTNSTETLRILKQSSDLKLQPIKKKYNYLIS